MHNKNQTRDYLQMQSEKKSVKNLDFFESRDIICYINVNKLL